MLNGTAGRMLEAQGWWLLNQPWKWFLHGQDPMARSSAVLVQ